MWHRRFERARPAPAIDAAVSFDAHVDANETGIATDASSIDAADALPASCVLTDSGPVTASADGQHFENLRIVAKGVPGIAVSGKKNIVIPNVVVLHDGAAGISLSNADGASLENVVVE